MLLGNFPSLANLVSGAGNRLAILRLDSSTSSDISEDSEDIYDCYGIR